MSERRPIIKIEIDQELAKVIRLFGILLWIICVLFIIVPHI